MTGARGPRIHASALTRSAFVLGAASLLGTLRVPARAATSPRVAIVGAGVAGLTCAYRLMQAGIASRVFEASDRIGGRTWTLRGYFAEGQIAEHGGEFISIGQREVQDLAYELGLSLVNLNRHETGIDTAFFNGARYSLAQAKTDYDAQVRGPLTQALRAAGYPTTYRRSTAAGRVLDRTSVAEWIATNVPGGLGSQLGGLLANACLGEFGGDLSEQSALNLIYLLGFEKPGTFNVDGTNEALHVIGGNDQIAGRMADALPAGALTTGAALVALRELADGSLRCTFSSGPRTFEVDADRVCLALPFTILRTVELRVPLSRLKRIAIDRLELGTNAKLHMQFKRRVWNAERYDGSSYVQFPYEESWDVSAAQPGQYGILVGFPGGQRGVLPAAAHGPAPRAIADEYVRELDRIYPGLAREYTGVAYLDEWAHDPWHRGAYSYYRVGQYGEFAGIERVPEGAVFFAGEQTSYTDMGYINGAVISGQRAAAEIARSV
jgi:monoamine oxidase